MTNETIDAVMVANSKKFEKCIFESQNLLILGNCSPLHVVTINCYLAFTICMFQYLYCPRNLLSMYVLILCTILQGTL